MAVIVSEKQKWETVYSAHRFWASLCKELYVRSYTGLQSKEDMISAPSGAYSRINTFDEPQEAAYKELFKDKKNLN